MIGIIIVIAIVVATLVLQGRDDDKGLCNDGQYQDGSECREEGNACKTSDAHTSFQVTKGKCLPVSCKKDGLVLTTAGCKHDIANDNECKEPNTLYHLNESSNICTPQSCIAGFDVRGGKCMPVLEEEEIERCPPKKILYEGTCYDPGDTCIPNKRLLPNTSYIISDKDPSVCVASGCDDDLFSFDGAMCIFSRKGESCQDEMEVTDSAHIYEYDIHGTCKPIPCNAPYYTTLHGGCQPNDDIELCDPLDDNIDVNAYYVQIDDECTPVCKKGFSMNDDGECVYYLEGDGCTGIRWDHDEGSIYEYDRNGKCVRIGCDDYHEPNEDDSSCVYALFGEECSDESSIPHGSYQRDSNGLCKFEKCHRGYSLRDGKCVFDGTGEPCLPQEINSNAFDYAYDANGDCNVRFCMPLWETVDEDCDTFVGDQQPCNQTLQDRYLYAYDAQGSCRVSGCDESQGFVEDEDQECIHDLYGEACGETRGEVWKTNKDGLCRFESCDPSESFVEGAPTENQCEFESMGQICSEPSDGTHQRYTYAHDGECRWDGASCQDGRVMIEGFGCIEDPDCEVGEWRRSGPCVTEREGCGEGEQTWKRSLGDDCIVGAVDTMTTSCYLGECPTEDCVVSEWKQSNIDECDCEDSSDQTIRLEREILQPAVGLGKECPELEKTTSCRDYCRLDAKICEQTAQQTSSCSETCGRGVYQTKNNTFYTGGDNNTCHFTTYSSCHTPCEHLEDRACVINMGDWSSCIRNCGTGFRWKTASVDLEPMNMGAPCDPLGVFELCETECDTNETDASDSELPVQLLRIDRLWIEHFHVLTNSFEGLPVFFTEETRPLYTMSVQQSIEIFQCMTDNFTSFTYLPVTTHPRYMYITPADELRTILPLMVTTETKRGNTSVYTQSFCPWKRSKKGANDMLCIKNPSTGLWYVSRGVFGGKAKEELIIDLRRKRTPSVPIITSTNVDDAIDAIIDVFASSTHRAIFYDGETGVAWALHTEEKNGVSLTLVLSPKEEISLDGTFTLWQGNYSLHTEDKFESTNVTTKNLHTNEMRQRFTRGIETLQQEQQMIFEAWS